MEVFRITRAPYVAQALTGDGARRDGGRWNSRGNGVIYCADSRALTALEFLVQTDPAAVPDDLVIITVSIPDRLSSKSLDINEMPLDWRKTPAPKSLQEIGDAWLQRGETTVLVVPSAIIPEERCMLINPRHPDATQVSIESTNAFVLDVRLL